MVDWCHLLEAFDLDYHSGERLLAWASCNHFIVTGFLKTHLQGHDLLIQEKDLNALQAKYDLLEGDKNAPNSVAFGRPIVGVVVVPGFVCGDTIRCHTCGKESVMVRHNSQRHAGAEINHVHADVQMEWASFFVVDRVREEDSEDSAYTIFMRSRPPGVSLVKPIGHDNPNESSLAAVTQWQNDQSSRARLLVAPDQERRTIHD